ncbi:MAG: MFS transporter [Bacillota bacterium]|nr:MFS transporter [Bacillota bacterium]
MMITAATLQSLLWSTMLPVVPLLARSLGATESQLGAIAMMPALIAIGLSLPAGALSTKYGKRASFLASAVLSTAGGLLYYRAGNLGGIVVPQLLFGLGNVLFWPTEKAYLTELVPERVRAQVVGYSMAISAGGGTFGPLIAGYLIDTAGFTSVFVFYMFLGVVCTLVSYALPRGERQANISLLRSLSGGIGQALVLLRRPVIKVTTVTTFFQFAAISVAEYFVPAYLREAGFSATFIGSTVTLRTAGMTIIRLFIGKMTKKVGMVQLLFVALAVCAISVGLMPVLPATAYVILGSFTLGAAFGLAPVLTAAVIAGQTVQSERNLAMALDSTVMYGSRIATGVVVGAAAEVAGFGPAIILANGVVLLGLLGVSMLYGKTARPATRAKTTRAAT